MHYLDVEYIEPEDFLENDYEYPVYTHLKGAALYLRKDGERYHREDLHKHPEEYLCIFEPYLSRADILMNGVYWDKHVPRLFAKHDVARADYTLNVIADITCDLEGSVPINQGSTTIETPVYGVNRFSLQRTEPFLHDDAVVDIMAVDNLPNELPRDASAHFGNHLEKYVLRELLEPKSDLIARATICENGKLTPQYEYLSDYAYGELKTAPGIVAPGTTYF